MYRMNPLWNSVVIGGVQDGKPFLGAVGMIGTHYVDDHICTGNSDHKSINQLLFLIRIWKSIVSSFVQRTLSS